MEKCKTGKINGSGTRAMKFCYINAKDNSSKLKRKTKK
jgi:hypothetical protein